MDQLPLQLTDKQSFCGSWLFYTMTTKFYDWLVVLEPKQMCQVKIWPQNTTNAQHTPLCQTIPYDDWFLIFKATKRFEP